MDSKILIDNIYKSLSKTLTDVSLELLKEDGNILNIKVISPSFAGMTESIRSDLVHEILHSEIPKSLIDFDITFTLVTKLENTSFSDFNQINEKSLTKTEKFASKNRDLE